MTLFVALMLTFGEPSWYEISSAQERCSMQGCLSEVSVGKPTTKLVEKEKKFQTSVFYEEDRFFLNYDLRKRLRNFVEEHPNQKRFVAPGF